MKIRTAKISDVKSIHSLISVYAERDRMLFRSLAEIYDHLQAFIVAADDNDEVIGCCMLSIVWSDLAEIKSLAVSVDQKGMGIGRALVEYAIKTGKDVGVNKVFALTLEPNFFEKVGFHRIDRRELPMKVWSDCAKCPKQDNCDEIAVVFDV